MHPSAVEGRERLRCPQCPFVLYQNPASAAAGVVLDADRRVLLVRRAIPPFRGSWALPAGYQELDEDAPSAAVREIREEAGIEVAVVRLLDLLFIPDDARKPVNLAVYLCRPLARELAPGSDVIAADWFDLERLPDDLAFDNGPRILHPLRGRVAGDGLGSL